MSVKIEDNKELKASNPFTVPEGYFENLTDRIMVQIPEVEEVKVVKVTLYDKIKPWLYMAAVFAGLGLFFKGIMKITSHDESKLSSIELIESERVKMNDITNSEMDEYIDFFTNRYYEDLYAEELKGLE